MVIEMIRVALTNPVTRMTELMTQSSFQCDENLIVKRMANRQQDGCTDVPELLENTQWFWNHDDEDSDLDGCQHSAEESHHLHDCINEDGDAVAQCFSDPNNKDDHLDNSYQWNNCTELDGWIPWWQQIPSPR